MADKPSTPVKVPESEVTRQATDALKGYVYQLDHTSPALFFHHNE
jgi:hypothetical protein